MPAPQPRPAKSPVGSAPANISIPEILGHLEAIERRTSERQDRAEERSSRERKEVTASFGQRIEDEANHAQKASLAQSVTLGERIADLGDTLGQRIDALGTSLAAQIEKGDDALGKRADELRASLLVERSLDREDAKSARKENRALISLLLLLIGGFGGLNLYFNADGTMGITQPGVTVAAEPEVP